MGSLALLAKPCPGATKAYFTSKESVEQEMISLIEKSRQSIDMALFELRSPRLASALETANQRGVQVRLILDAEHAREGLAAGEVRLLGGKNTGRRGVMHHKFALFDRKEVVTGSFNWTPGAEHTNYENALILDDPETVRAYTQEFETLWRRAIEGPPPGVKPYIPPAASRKGKGHHSSQSRLKCIKIRLPKPVIKHRRKTHTNRP